MAHSPLLLPQPRELTLIGGECALPVTELIALDAEYAPDLLFTAERLQQALEQTSGGTWTIAGGDLADAVIRLRVDASAGGPVRHAEGYQLAITADGVSLIGRDLAGVFYGCATLVQLLQTYGMRLPTLEIRDWPDFSARGVMLDISRDRVPTLETLYALIDRLASWKINQLQLYTEHTFAYRDHPIVWRHASPLTAEDILHVDAYCRQRFIELVPNQNSFGHMHRWLRHPAYLHLAETEVGVETPWRTRMDHPFSLSPAAPEVLPFLESLFDELLPNFSSRQFNVGCDETFDLGVGRSRDRVAAQGKGRVYLDFVLEIYRRVSARGRTMQFWGDIINQYPDLVPEIPKDTIAMEWGYEADHDFPEHTRLFAESGIPFYVCPGTSSWTSIAGRTDNAVGNIRGAVENGLQHGAIGVLNTDWGDLGHWQQHPISFLGLAYGAAMSWGSAHNRDLDLPAALSAFAFEDRAHVLGQLVYDLGNIYHAPGVHVHNGSMLFWLYQHPLSELRAQWDELPDGERRLLGDDHALRLKLGETLEQIEAIMQPLQRAQMRRPDSALITRELLLTAQMAAHAARRGLWQIDGRRAEGRPALLRELDALEAEYRSLWLARSRPGGLEDSAGRLRSSGRLLA